MDKFFITTDKTADYPDFLLKDEKDFAVLDMSYVVDGKLYSCSDGLSNKEFYQLLSEGKTSSTSMVSVENTQAFFEDILAKGYDVLHVSFSSALSGSYEGYLKAASGAMKNYPDRKIAVVDSLSATCGEALLVYYVLRKRDEGASFDECTRYASELRDHIGHVFTVDDLMHLYRGGRLKKTTATVGKALNMKPVLMVSEEGKLVPTNTVMGRRPALKTMVDKMEVKNAGYDDKLIIIAHCDAFDDAMTLKKMVETRLGKSNVQIAEISPIVGTHLGKGGLTMFYLAKDKIPFIR